MAPPADPDDPPFVEIDGRRFYADRCYLNAMAGRDDNNDDDDAGAAANPGIQLFSRRRLVAALSSSEGLEACILTTYSVDVPDLEADFPALFAPESRVPTLLLHGDKRVRRAYAEAPEGPYRVWKEVVDNPNRERSRGEERTPHWEYPAMDARIQVQSVVPYYCDAPGGAPPSRSLGAFHPKVCLLVTRASLVIVVSTANLGSQATVDLSWVQSFPRRHQPQPQPQQGSTGFGRALTDFLARIEESLGHQAWQSRKTEGEAAGAGTEWNGPLSFFRRHLGSSELDAMFDFSAAAVDFVASVPVHKESSPDAFVRYGLERMTQLLKGRAGQLPAAVHEARRAAEQQANGDGDNDLLGGLLPTAPAWDKLRVQVTTIGQVGRDKDGKMREGSSSAVMAQTLQALLPDVEMQWERHERVEWFWPSLEYIKTSRRFPSKYRDDLDEETHAEYTQKKVGGFLFLAPDDLVDLQEYWKQLRRFELHPALANPPILRAEDGAYGLDRWTNVSPHLKTFSRGLPSASDSADYHGGQPLAWLWLTSANLSGGALGCNGYMRNFEAGVLFHSGPDAVYHTWPPTVTTITTTPSSQPPSPGWPATARSIPLPLPYRLDAPHYTPQDDPWDPTPDLLIPPFFHSLYDLPNLARLKGLRPQIEAIFAQVQEDLKELAARHGLDARGRPLRILPQQVSVSMSAPLAAPPQPLASSDGNAARGREEGEVGEGGGSEPKRLKAAATAAAAGECAGGTRAM